MDSHRWNQHKIADRRIRAIRTGYNDGIVAARHARLRIPAYQLALNRMQNAVQVDPEPVKSVFAEQNQL